MNKFEELVKNEMERVVKQHACIDERYSPTRVSGQIIDAENLRAAFVLREQIDIDPGGLGNQYRYSVWYAAPCSETRRIYEDHEYDRVRDSSIDITELLADGVMASVSLKNVAGRTANSNKIKAKILLNGTLESPTDFMDRAENLVKKNGPRHGHDGITTGFRVGEENIAVFVWAAGNGVDNEYNTVYLVWKDKTEQLNHRRITSSSKYLHPEVRRTKDLLSIIIDNKVYNFSSEDLKI